MDNLSSQKRDTDRRKMRKRTELSLAIPLIAICLLVSPLVSSFTSTDGQADFTSAIIYIFGIWGALIFLAYLISRVLNNDVKDD